VVTKESFIKFRILAFCMKALSLIFSLLSAISPTHSNSLDNRIQTAIYEPVKAQIVARESRELYATEKNRDLIYGLQGIEMYPLVQIRNTETNDTFYASTTDKITLNNVQSMLHLWTQFFQNIKQFGVRLNLQNPLIKI